MVLKNHLIKINLFLEFTNGDAAARQGKSDLLLVPGRIKNGSQPSFWNVLVVPRVG